MYRILHEKMIKSTVDASITKFYDTTTSGKILNRYSAGIKEVDCQIWM